MPNVKGAVSSDACLAPPGYGWNGDGTSTVCDPGFYNPGWNREACTQCGVGTITTAAQGSVSPDQCYTPAGNGNKRSADGLTWNGYPCPANTYGRPTNTFGLVDVECTKCMEHTSTEGATMQTDGAACVADAGYGYYDGEVKQCDYGYYSAAGGRDACAYCGLGYNTTNTGMEGVLGASAATQCHVAAGWGINHDGSNLHKCERGYFKYWIWETTCQKCMFGTTTSLMAGATLWSDCDTCRPGFGIASGVVDLTRPQCDICTSSTYSAGYTPGGQECGDCPNPPSFSGKMVSRQVGGRGLRADVCTESPRDCSGDADLAPSRPPPFCSPVRPLSWPPPADLLPSHLQKPLPPTPGHQHPRGLCGRVPV
jgi:hypothetical protein